MKDQFELVSEYKPSGDQPEAIKELVSGLKEDKKFQTRQVSTMYSSSS